MATKDTGKRRVCLVDDYSESRKENFAEEKEYKTQNMSGMTVLEKAVCLAETVSKIIQSKQESVMLFSHLNQLLEDKRSEILSELAKASQLVRVNLINAIFMEVVKQTHRETYVQKHLVSFMPFNACVLVPEINSAFLSKCDRELLHPFDERKRHAQRGPVDPQLEHAAIQEPATARASRWR